MKAIMKSAGEEGDVIQSGLDVRTKEEVPRFLKDYFNAKTPEFRRTLYEIFNASLEDNREAAEAFVDTSEYKDTLRMLRRWDPDLFERCLGRLRRILH